MKVQLSGQIQRVDGMSVLFQFAPGEVPAIAVKVRSGPKLLGGRLSEADLDALLALLAERFGAPVAWPHVTVDLECEIMSPGLDLPYSSVDLVVRDSGQIDICCGDVLLATLSRESLDSQFWGAAPCGNAKEDEHRHTRVELSQWLGDALLERVSLDVERRQDGTAAFSAVWNDKHRNLVLSGSGFTGKALKSEFKRIVEFVFGPTGQAIMMTAVEFVRSNEKSESPPAANGTKSTTTH